MLRKGPSPRAAATWSVDRGYPMQVLGRKGAWVRSSRTSRQAHVVSTASALNVRRTPNAKARIKALRLPPAR